MRFYSVYKDTQLFEKVKLFFDAQNHTQCHAEECGEQHLKGGRQQESDCVRWIPEQRDGLGKNKTVLDIPIDLFRQGLADLQWMAEEALQ